ncbi:ATP dependent DNA ligase domain-containing protein [Xylariales sp. AK1849]|nr:ATP dependent DNA ligase domain-containing protein [Xylariales sp. AK1849]
MPFPFRYICDLLQRLDDEARSSKKQRTPSKSTIENWFRDHRLRLDAPTIDARAILSTLLPERRTDRVYNLQVNRLESIIGPALTLGHSRVKELRRYKTPGLGVDLGDCVERLLTATPNPKRSDEVTVEEIDETLHRIAASCRFSSPAVRACRGSGGERTENHELAQFYCRLTARDAKWFTRLVLKNFQPVVLDEPVILRAYHVLLPQILKVGDDFTVAARLLRDISRSPGDQSSIASILKPALGTKVGRQSWLKGRTIKHCVDMARNRRMSCEQKIDGEYCQIHIDLRKHLNSIQIFSKSGKDSTRDRDGLHRAIRDSLRLGIRDCPLKKGCILEGELVVYSTKDQKILPFHKIRKHVSRSGSFIGTGNDSQRHEYEHLMIIYYDVLVIDDESLLGMRHSERFKRLESLVACRKGHAELVKRQVISFSQRNAASLLRDAFAKCIVARGEGLVLKPDEPYFDFSTGRKAYASINIKLKKEYIKGWGDVGDFAVIGASYNAAKASTYKIPNLKWTDFFIGCLENRDSARARTEKPRFMVTNVVELNETLLKTFRTHANPASIPLKQNVYLDLDFRGIGNGKTPTEIFPDPAVFDMRCFSFDKEGGSRTWSMRFPMVSKIHFDRSYLDAISFVELQQAARAATEAPEMEDSQEMRRWVSKLEKADPRGKAVDLQSQETVSTDTSIPPNTNDQETGQSNNPRAITGPATDIAEAPIQLTDTEAAPRIILMTPPRSSTAEKPETSSKRITTPSRQSERLKRSNELSITTNAAKMKRQRRVSSASSLASASTRSSFSGPTSSPNKQRRPLGAIDPNNSPVKQRSHAAGFLPDTAEASATSPSTEGHFPSSVTASFHTAAELPSSPPRCPPTRNPHLKEQQTNSAPDQRPGEVAHCAHKRAKCAFANCTFLLAPCISQYAWVADLLRGHGIVDYAVDPQNWRQPRPAVSSPPATSETSDSADGSERPCRIIKKGKTRRICLVEVRRSGPTQDFMQSIERAGLRQGDDQREWISVYDWRLLEDITKSESGVSSKGPDPWRHRYVGIA